MDDSRKRLTYLMLFRVGVVTLLLVATAVAEMAAPVEQSTSPTITALFGLIAAHLRAHHPLRGAAAA